MTNRSLILLSLLIVLCLGASYGLRYALMEGGQWVGLCTEQAARWECQLRSLLGWLIHFRVIAWLALGLALPGFFIPNKYGSLLAVLALCCAIAAMILYSASLAAFALVLAALRLVRSPAARAGQLPGGRAVPNATGPHSTAG